MIIHNRESSQELVIEECRAIIRFFPKSLTMTGAEDVEQGGPNFSAKKKNVVQPMRIFYTSRISWNCISDWQPLPKVFLFGTENWEQQLKKTLYYIANISKSYQGAARPPPTSECRVLEHDEGGGDQQQVDECLNMFCHITLPCAI